MREAICMKAVNIKLSLAENVKTFVNIANRYPYDIDLRVGRHVVDGKSILGIFSLDLSKPITLEVYADNCEDLMEEIKPFIIGCQSVCASRATGLEHTLRACRRFGMSRYAKTRGAGAISSWFQNSSRSCATGV